MGGQTYEKEDGEKNFVSKARGIIYKEGNNMEILRSNIELNKELYENSDICFFQEYQTQEFLDYKYAPRFNDLVFKIDKQILFNPHTYTNSKIDQRLYKCPYKLCLNNNNNNNKICIDLYNYHGIIISNTSSLSQIIKSLDLLEYIVNLKDNVIIAGDFNYEFVGTLQIEDSLNEERDILDEFINYNINNIINNCINTEYVYSPTAEFQRNKIKQYGQRQKKFFELEQSLILEQSLEKQIDLKQQIKKLEDKEILLEKKNLLNN